MVVEEWEGLLLAVLTVEGVVEGGEIGRGRAEEAMNEL